MSQPSTQHPTSAASSALHSTSHTTQTIPLPTFNKNQVKAAPNPTYPSSSTLFPPQTPPFPTTYPNSNTSLPYFNTNTPTYDPSHLTLYRTQPQSRSSLLLPHHIPQPESIDEQISKLQHLRALQAQQQAELVNRSRTPDKSSRKAYQFRTPERSSRKRHRDRSYDSCSSSFTSRKSRRHKRDKKHRQSSSSPSPDRRRSSHKRSPRTSHSIDDHHHTQPLSSQSQPPPHTQHFNQRLPDQTNTPPKTIPVTDPPCDHTDVATTPMTPEIIQQLLLAILN